MAVLLGDSTASRPRPLLGLFILAMVVANTPVIAKYRNKDDCIYRANKVYLSATNENDVIVMAKFYPPNYLHYLHEPRPRIHFCEFGNFVAADSSLVADLDRAALTGGRAILDPMLTMPEETELAQMRFFVSGDRDTVEVALRSLVGSCRARGVPVLAVHRTGDPWATYAPYDLGPGVAWTDPELRPIASE